MASYEMLGFMEGFANTRSKMIDKEQEKQDKLKERMQEMAIKGMEKRYEQHQKNKVAMSNIKSLVSAGKIDQATMAHDQLIGGAAGAKALGAKGMSDFEGVEKKMVGLRSEQQRKYLEAQIKAFEAQKEPELDMDSINNIQVQRGVDNMTLEGWLRERVGLKGEDVPTANSYAGLFATSQPIAQDTTVKSGTSYVDAPDKDAGKMTTTLVPVNNNDGSVTVHRVDHNKYGETSRPIIGKKPETVVRKIDKAEMKLYDSMLNQRALELENDNSAPEDIRDKIGDMLQDENNRAIHSATISEIMRIQGSDSTKTPEETFEQAWNTVKQNAEYAIQLADDNVGSWWDTYTWKQKIKVQDPKGNVWFVPWHQAKETVDKGGKVIP